MSDLDFKIHSSTSSATTVTSAEMADLILGDAFTINAANTSYSGDNFSGGTYTNADTDLPGVLPSDEGVIFSTGFLAQFSNDTGANNAEPDTSGQTSGVDNDPDFNAANGTPFGTRDASFIEIEFETVGSTDTTLTLEFRFYSEEYNEYVYSNFNDVALVMYDGVQVPISVGDGTISVNSINNAAATPPQFGSEANDPNPGNGQFDSASPNLYIDNTAGGFDTEMDGFTVTLSLDITVTAGTAHTLKIGVADTGDDLWDSAFAIAGNSNTANADPIASDDTVTVARGFTQTADLLANDTDPDNPATLFITEINGVSVMVGTQVQLNTGEIIEVTGAGTILVIGNSAPVGQTFFSYTIEDGDGNTDSAFVTLNTTTPCFVEGTAILTATGARPVETLRPGDLIVTRDRGIQPLVWVGDREVSGAAMFASDGHMAPIVIPAGAFGPGLPSRELRVSPAHRMLHQGHRLPLLTGQTECLTPARLLDGFDGITQAKDMAPVKYFHLLFDQHEVIYAEGAPTESLHPGSIGLHGFSEASRQSLFEARPDLRSDLGVYGPTARYVLTSPEVRALLVA